MEDKARLAFYIDGGLEKLIERYDVSDEEKRVLYRIKRMIEHRRDIDWALVDEGDRLIANIYKTREPKAPIALKIIEDNREHSKNLEVYTKTASVKKTLFRSVLFFILTYGLVIMVDFLMFGKDSDYYTYIIKPIMEFFGIKWG